MASPDSQSESHGSSISSSKSEIELALRRNLHELQRLAVFYHKRGRVDQAREIYDMMVAIENRLDMDEIQLRERDERSLGMGALSNNVPTSEPS